MPSWNTWKQTHSCTDQNEQLNNSFVEPAETYHVVLPTGVILNEFKIGPAAAASGMLNNVINFQMETNKQFHIYFNL